MIRYAQYCALILASIVSVALAECPSSFTSHYQRCLSLLQNGDDPNAFLQTVLITVNHDKFISNCRDHTILKHCMERVLSLCPGKRVEHEQQFHVIDKIMAVLCNTHAGYRQNIVCIVSQRNGLMSRRCDKIYGLRRLAGDKESRYYCSLLEDLFLCKDSLVRSACGHAAADAVFTLNSIIYDRIISQHQCQLSVKNSPAIEAFQYSTPCPPSFPSRLAFCSDRFIKSAPPVYSVFPVVIQGVAADVDMMCSAQNDYHDCISSVVETCPRGTKFIEDTFHWNVKHELASYMCSVSDAYKLHLKCYTSLVTESGINDENHTCNIIRHSTVQLLRNYYMYACNKSAQHNATYLKSQSDALISCLTTLTMYHCGKAAANVIQPLLQTKFGLQQFRLNCDGTVMDDGAIPAERNGQQTSAVVDSIENDSSAVVRSSPNSAMRTILSISSIFLFTCNYYILHRLL